MTNKNNYKPSSLDSINHIIDVAEHAYMTKCKARGCKNPVPFHSMMKGYVYGCILLVVAVIFVVMK